MGKGFRMITGERRRPEKRVGGGRAEEDSGRSGNSPLCEAHRRLPRACPWSPFPFSGQDVHRPAVLKLPIFLRQSGQNRPLEPRPTEMGDGKNRERREDVFFRRLVYCYIVLSPPRFFVLHSLMADRRAWFGISLFASLITMFVIGDRLLWLIHSFMASRS